MSGPSARTLSALRARLGTLTTSAPTGVLLAFFLFGLINNVLYVVILAAALDLVGPALPKGLVLLFDVVPGFLTKLVAPYFIHAVPYAVRIPALAAIAAAGMLLVAVSPAYDPSAGAVAGPVAVKMTGVVLASVASGAGELSFLGLTHHYGQWSLAAWGSGTGAAGLVGAGAYAVATTGLGWSVRATLLGSAVLPVGMVLSFFAVLPRWETKRAHVPYVRVESVADGEVEGQVLDEAVADPEDADVGLLAQPVKNTLHERQESWLASLEVNLRRARKLFWPFMMPLLSVYFAEYTINQGVSPTLLFPLESSPFKHFRAFYPTYNAIYQLGVFVSRSSTPILRVHNLYLPSMLQVANLVFLILQALFDFIPSVYFIFVIIFWEGLLGGLVYVNTFAEILDTVPMEDREFSLGATSVSDSAGICIAGFMAMALEVSLCSYQVSDGRDYCKKL